MTTCCLCDRIDHPSKPEIPAGLPALPRQLAGFPEYRLAMLREIPTYAALARWRAREGDDLGLMLLEMWAYVLDILAFYDERIANETYLRTAIRPASLYRLVRLIGYQPRPALAASVVLAALAEGKQPVILPPRTGFRSDAFDGEPPQIFETEIEQTIHPFLNQWTLAQVRDPLPNGNELLLEIDTARLAPDQLVLFRWQEQLHAGRVTRIQTINALDGNTYLKVEVNPPPVLDGNVPLNTVEVLSPTLSASPNLGTIDGSSSPTEITLDTIYPELAEQEPVIFQRGNELHEAAIANITSVDIPVSQDDDAPTLPATRITICDADSLPEEWIWISNLSRLIVHFQMTTAGSLTRVAKTHVDKADFEPSGIPIEGIVEFLPEDVSTSGQLLLQDANDNGLLVDGSASINPEGEGTITLDSGIPAFNPLLRKPITVFGNLIRASRGESVIDEVIGSGDGTQTFQAFALQNNPLTYLNDPSAPNGRRSTLAIRVNGILWREVASFFGTGPQDEVYIVRQNDRQETTVTFGDGSTGARLPTGIENVTATYRFGAGATKPPGGAIAQVANPVAGLRRVVSPVEAGGGGDGDRLQDIRSNAPNSALILGRAVSLQDFEALAREFGGVINARVEWAWDETCQGAVVKVWFISDGGDIADALKAFLVGQAAPTTPLIAYKAIAQPSELIIDVTLDSRFTTPTVVEQIRQALTDEETGVLALANIPIGRPLFRSQIFAAVLAVEGTCSVNAMTVDGSPAPFAITVAEGHYRDFLSNLLLDGTTAGDLTSLKESKSP